MSWDDNCKALCNNYPSLACLCVAGLDGNLYGSSDRGKCTPTAEEIKALVKIQSGADPSATNFVLCGVKYFILRRVDDVLIGKHDKFSMICGKTQKIAILGLCDESQGNRGGNAMDAVFKLQDYFSGSGF